MLVKKHNKKKKSLLSVNYFFTYIVRLSQKKGNDEKYKSYNWYNKIMFLFSTGIYREQKKLTPPLAQKYMFTINFYSFYIKTFVVWNGISMNLYYV